MKPNPMHAAGMLAAAASSLLLAALPARAACLTDAEVSALFDAYNRAEPAASPDELSTADGECSRAKFNRMLGLQLGDPVVRVSSEAINQARSLQDLMMSIDQLIPFIELPDLVVQAPGKLNGAAITAINVGARLGVPGTPLAVPARLLPPKPDMAVEVAYWGLPGTPRVQVSFK